MKRINETTGLPFKQGDVREDGHVFLRYKLKRLKKNGYFVEDWHSPESFEKQRATVSRWHKANPEKNRAADSRWQKANPEKQNAINAKRRAAKLKRTPPWLTPEHLEQIKAFYALAKSLEKSTGVVHHVDHIVPLQGDNVSGLHVPWNLQVITASENCSKNNKFGF